MAAVLVAALLFVSVTSYFSCWCCVRERDQREMCDTTIAVTRLLAVNNVPYWICWGSLLGAVREADMPFQV